jgi:hypothetical protein
MRKIRRSSCFCILFHFLHLGTIDPAVVHLGSRLPDIMTTGFTKKYFTSYCRIFKARVFKLIEQESSAPKAYFDSFFPPLAGLSVPDFLTSCLAGLVSAFLACNLIVWRVGVETFGDFGADGTNPEADLTREAGVRRQRTAVVACIMFACSYFKTVGTADKVMTNKE